MYEMFSKFGSSFNFETFLKEILKNIRTNYLLFT